MGVLRDGFSLSKYISIQNKTENPNPHESPPPYPHRTAPHRVDHPNIQTFPASIMISCVFFFYTVALLFSWGISACWVLGFWDGDLRLGMGRGRGGRGEGSS